MRRLLTWWRNFKRAHLSIREDDFDWTGHGFDFGANCRRADDLPRTTASKRQRQEKEVQ